MVNGVWGRKIGMTQVFSEKNKVVPVTVIDLNHWLVTNIKTENNDGYNAIQVGCLRDRYDVQTFDKNWLKDLKSYFRYVREIKVNADALAIYQVGQPLDSVNLLTVGDQVNVVGTTKGRGYQGVIKRHNFAGGRASHGPRFGRWPGSMGFMRSQGKVIKGKKLPGHMGVDQRVMRGLEIIRLESQAKIALVKGSVPGGAGSLVFVEKV
jgi:large subunit ribosomal protein L3